MDSVIQQFYKNIIQQAEMLDDIDRIIELHMKEKKNELETKNYEQYREELVDVAMKAQESGFYHGFQAAVILMGECYNEKKRLF